MQCPHLLCLTTAATIFKAIFKAQKSKPGLLGMYEKKSQTVFNAIKKNKENYKAITKKNKSTVENFAYLFG